MERFTTLVATMMPLPVNDVDTDQIIPASYLKVINKDGLVDGRSDRGHDPTGLALSRNHGSSRLGSSRVTCLRGRSHSEGPPHHSIG